MMCIWDRSILHPCGSSKSPIGAHPDQPPKTYLVPHSIRKFPPLQWSWGQLFWLCDAFGWVLWGCLPGYPYAQSLAAPYFPFPKKKSSIQVLPVHIWHKLLCLWLVLVQRRLCKMLGFFVGPSTSPLIKPTDFNSFRCWETVDWDKGNSSTMSPQMQLRLRINTSKMAMRAGCPNALVTWASRFWAEVNFSVLVVPINIAIIRLNYLLAKMRWIFSNFF